MVSHGSLQKTTWEFWIHPKKNTRYKNDRMVKLAWWFHLYWWSPWYHNTVWIEDLKCISRISQNSKKHLNDILKKNYLIISQKCLKNIDVYSARHLDPSWATSCSNMGDMGWYPKVILIGKWWSIGEVGVPYKAITSQNQWHIDIWKCHLPSGTLT